MAFGYGLDAAVALFRVYFGLGSKEVCACGVHVHVHCMSMSACIERHTACDVALLRLSWPLRAPRAISFMLRVCLHRHRACARWSRLRSTRSQPSCFAADGAAPAISGGGASARQTLEANKSAVGVAMQFLVMIDKLHDMHERQVISDLHFEQWSDWACEHVTRQVELYRACAM